jgi:predicted flap endonuclease-1-like 5' DNA nuclease
MRRRDCRTGLDGSAVPPAVLASFASPSQRGEAVKITDVEGIGPVFGEKLNAAGVQTTDDLLERGATRKGRQDLADQSGLTGAQILGWVNRSARGR